MADRSPYEGTAGPAPSPAARELLRAFKEHESPSPAARDLGFAALRTRLEDSADVPSAAANSRIYGIAKATLVTLAVAAAVLLAIKAVGSGVTALADRARQPAMEAPYQGEAGSDGGQAVARAPQVLPRRGGGAPVEASVPAAEALAPVVHEATVRDELPPREAASSTAPARSPRPRPAVSPSPTSDDLAVEVALIKRATEAKAERRFADGLTALREHAQRFPKGVLADERMVLKAELQCAAGRVSEADALVERFLRERAGSALIGRMRNVCRE